MCLAVHKRSNAQCVIFQDALKDQEGKDNQDEDLSIPMLMRNKVPTVEGYEQDEKLDIAMRPEEVL